MSAACFRHKIAAGWWTGQMAWLYSPVTKLQNARPLICILVNNNSAYCVSRRSTKRTSDIVCKRVAGYSELVAKDKMDINSNKGESSGGHLTLTRPYVDKQGAVKLADLLFGLRISDLLKVKEFVSYDDRNFYLKGVLPNQNKQGNSTEDEFVLKVLNHVDSQNTLYVNAQNELLLHLKEHGFVCPVPVRSLRGEFTIECELSSYGLSGSEDNAKTPELPCRINAVRILSYVPGKLLKDVLCTNELLFNLGRYTAKMNKALKSFQHPGLCDLVKQEWDLSQLNILESYIPVASQDVTEFKLLRHVYSKFVNGVIPKLGELNKQVIHGDLNDENILVLPYQHDTSHTISFLDYGDSSDSYRVFEVAICMMYMIMLRVKQGDTHQEAISAVGHVLSGYQSVYSLSHSELDLLYWSVAARFFQSIVIGMYKQSLEPENIYLSQTCQIGLKILSSYIAASERETLNSWLSTEMLGRLHIK